MILILYIILEFVNIVNSVEPIVSAAYTIRRNGYPAELHRVITEDSYILTLHRIPYSPRNNVSDAVSTRVPVLLIHGLAGIADNFLFMGAGKSIGFILSDAGYDVWLGNVRGSTHSRRHMWLNPDTDGTYWDFSWHEIGYHDLPSMVDYILKSTGHKKLHYIGHSQGTTTAFVMLSEKPAYNQKIISYSAFAPAVFLTHIEDPILTPLSHIFELLHELAKVIEYHEMLFPGRNVLIQELMKTMCGYSRSFRDLFLHVVGLFNGYQIEQMDKKLVPAFASMVPGGNSIKQATHFTQIIRSGVFRRFDYRLFGNIQRYNQITPPVYNLRKITAPVGLFYGHNDITCHKTDVEKLATKLNSLQLLYLVPHRNFSHLDFIVAKDANKLLYDRTIEFMKTNEKKMRSIRIDSYRRNVN